MRFLLFPVITMVLFFIPLQTGANENIILDNLDIAADSPEGENKAEPAAKPRYNFFGESISIFIPIREERVEENTGIERNIYPWGIGGSILYKTYILNRLFSPDKALPGVLLGFTSTFYMMEPKEEYQDRFGELTIFTLGMYTGYQFLIPVSRRVSISPALYGGARYYISFHFFENELSTAYSPIIISGIDVSLIFDNVFSLSLKGEYQVYIEGEVKQTAHISAGSGIYF